MVQSIHKFSGSLSEAGLASYVQACHSIEIEDLLLQVCDRDRALQLGRKVAHLDSRNLSLNAQNILSQSKANNFRDKRSLLLELAAATCQFGSSAFGGTANAVGAGLAAFGHGWDAGAKYGDKLINAQGQLLEFNYQRQGHIFSDHSQGAQSAEKGQEQAAVIADRIIQNSRRQSELVAGGS